MLKQWIRPDCLPQPETIPEPEVPEAVEQQNENDETTEVTNGE
jgi:hypothetical protein